MKNCPKCLLRWKSEFLCYNVKMTRRSQALGKKACPSSASCCLDLRSTAALGQQEALSGRAFLPGSLDRLCHFVPKERGEALAGHLGTNDKLFTLSLEGERGAVSFEYFYWFVVWLELQKRSAHISDPVTDLPGYSDTVYSDTSLIVTLFDKTNVPKKCHCKQIFVYNDTLPLSRRCHSNRGDLFHSLFTWTYWNFRSLNSVPFRKVEEN